MTQRPIIVAELSANHLGKLDHALDIIKAAAAAGVDAIKFQTYTANTMTLDLKTPNFLVSPDHPLWGNRNLYSIYEEAYTPWEWHEQLFSTALASGITPFSSPFDRTAVDFLENLNCPMYKIASLETTDGPLISYAASTGKPLIISTGASTLEEIDIAVETAIKAGNTHVTLLVCTSAYPAEVGDSNLRRIATLKSRYGLSIGLSDHTLGDTAAIVATGLGASMIEKHLTLKRSDGGLDSAFSLEPQEMAGLVKSCKLAAQSLGSAEWGEISAESESRRLRRSLYVVVQVKKGDLVSAENVRAIRPGEGLPPYLWDTLMGATFLADASPGTPLTDQLIVKRAEF